MYIFDLNKLKKGDIILEKDDDQTSELVRKLSHSTFSHAILYVGGGSCLEADDIVISFNIQRKLVENKDYVCVLRLKDEVDPLILENIIVNARLNVGMSYSLDDAKGIISEKYRPGNPRRQTCTRFVAQSFEKAGVKIVDNANFCSTEELLNSNLLIKVEDVLREATDKDVEFANSESVLPKQHEIIKKVLEDAREITNSDVQEINELKNFVIQHQEYDDAIADILIQSGYLELWREEEERLPYHYDLTKFVQYYGKNALAAAQFILEESQPELMRFMFCHFQLLQDVKGFGHLKVVKLFADLYENLTDFTMRRMVVAKSVIDYFYSGLIDDDEEE